MKYVSILLLAFSFSGLTAYAQEDEQTPVVAEPSAYVNLVPALVGNYGAGGKLKYYKADIALRVKAENVARVEYHEPLIRDQLIQLFAQQTDENLGSNEGKEAMRQAALLQVQNTLKEEEGEILVDDLLFNNLIVQP
ncbi:MAG: flagellar basal body-associated protein FliL [Gammaproteobacteria bacterium]|nr:flagellar basal body-associated protein FliL [Gammaproteobacteria bacterium]